MIIDLDREREVYGCENFNNSCIMLTQELKLRLIAHTRSLTYKQKRFHSRETIATSNYEYSDCLSYLSYLSFYETQIINPVS